MNRFKKVISVLLAAVLILTLIPPIDRVSAAPNIEIQSWATAPEKDGKPDWSRSQVTAPSTVTTKQIDIQVNYSGIADDNVSLLHYEIKNMTTGQTRVVKDTLAVKVGTQTLQFTDVELTEGLNRITVVLDTPAKPQSLPAWIQFTEVATISDLRIDDRLFSNGIFVPEQNLISQQNHIFIDGKAPNATEVRGMTYFDSQGSLPGFLRPGSGEFTFSAGESNVNLRLRPGDNDVTIVASNPTKTYTAERSFIYNNGRSFLYNTNLATTPGVTLPTDKKLYKEPIISSTSTDPVINLTSDIKINRSTGTLTHNQVNLEINKNGKTHEIRLRDLNETTRTVIADIVNTVTGFVESDLTLTIEVKNDYYLIKNVPINNVPIDLSRSIQSLEAEFIGTAGYNNDLQLFVFHYEDKNAPYVSSVKFKETGKELFSGIEINVSTTAIEFLVEVQNGNGVEVFSNHQSAALATVKNTANPITITIPKGDLPEGLSTLRFVPLNGDNDFPVGAREYLINYNPAPYIYLMNTYNGEVFNSDENPKYIDGNNNSRIGLQMKPVNIPKAQWGDIRVRLNENMDIVRASDHYDAKNEIHFNFASRSSDWKLQNGLNNITIEIFPQNTLNGGTNPGNVKPITTFTYELFYFTDDIPEVIKLDLEKEFADTHNYRQMDGQTFRYYTQESTLKFETAVRNADEVRIIVYRYDSDGKDVTEEATLKWNGTGFTETDPHNIIQGYRDVEGTNDHGNATITSALLNLHGTGTNSVEITATNKGGLFSTRLMEIVREPATLIVHYPIIDPVSNIGTVNGNFTQMYIEAEGADKIILDKNTQITDKTEVFLRDGSKDLFVFDIKGLKKGNNKISFTIVRGNREDKAEITLINVDTPITGAVFKDSISKGTLRAFNRQIELKFPKGTVLRKNDENASNQFLSPNRDIYIGIADPTDGRVNKTLHPLESDYNRKFDTRTEWQRGYLYLLHSGNFKSVSPLYWIDAGMIDDDANQSEALYGGGNDPYTRDKEFYKRTSANYSDLFVPSQSGQLTIAYDPNIVQSAWRYVTVFHYGYNEDHLGNKRFEWKNIGGVVNSKNNTITVPIQEFGYYRVMYMDRSFDDVVNHPWARDYLDTLYSKGIMKNKEQGRFETNSPITRGEFATLLVKAFELPLNYQGNNTFTDVTPRSSDQDGLYEYKYIETAARAGIIRGGLGGWFYPGDRITREDAAVMIARAANLKLETNADRARQQLDKVFTDISRFGDYTIPAVLAVNKAGYIDGKPNNMGPNDKKPTYYFDPKANLTRAEAAAIMMRVMLKAKKIPSL